MNATQRNAYPKFPLGAYADRYQPAPRLSTTEAQIFVSHIVIMFTVEERKEFSVALHKFDPSYK